MCFVRVKGYVTLLLPWVFLVHFLERAVSIKKTEGLAGNMVLYLSADLGTAWSLSVWAGWDRWGEGGFGMFA